MEDVTDDKKETLPTKAEPQYSFSSKEEQVLQLKKDFLKDKISKGVDPTTPGWRTKEEAEKTVKEQLREIDTLQQKIQKKTTPPILIKRVPTDKKVPLDDTKKRKPIGEAEMSDLDLKMTKKVITGEDLDIAMHGVRVAGSLFIRKQFKEDVTKYFKDTFDITFVPDGNGKNLMILLEMFANSYGMCMSNKIVELLSLPKGAQLELDVRAVSK
jgi:hypothetical protein